MTSPRVDQSVKIPSISAAIFRRLPVVCKPSWDAGRQYSRSAVHMMYGSPVSKAFGGSGVKLLYSKHQSINHKDILPVGANTRSRNVAVSPWHRTDALRLHEQRYDLR